MKKILVVEDSDDVRENLIDLLEINDYTVFAALNGFDGYKQALEEVPDLIISDIMMPGVDGLEMMKMLRNNSITSSIPIILLTAKTSQQDIRSGMNLGADDYLTKPFSAPEVLEAVNVRLNRKETIDGKMRKVYQNFSSYIPNELRSPLIGILGYTDLLIDEIYDIDREELKDFLIRIRQSSYKLQKNIERFLAFSETEMMAAGRKDINEYKDIETEINDYDLSIVIQDRMQVLQRELPYEINIEKAKVNMLQEHFDLIFEEIIDNAIKFSYPNKPVLVSAVYEDETYKLSVKNSGQGVNNEFSASFESEESGDKDFYSEQGKGMGLMIVRKLCDFYKIKIEAESYPDESYQVTLTFGNN